jgi:endonuclease/exonuclease/phosphatase family metal-dependent hydrolase
LIGSAFVDQLSETLAALRKNGAKYKAAAMVKNLDTATVQIAGFPPGIPFSVNGAPALLTAIDRDVILVRSDLYGKPVSFNCSGQESLDGCNYRFIASAQLPGGGELRVERGFVGIDIKVQSNGYRLVNTHLEVREPDKDNSLSRVYQAAQAAELIATLKATTPHSRTLLVIGDLNSSPEDVEIPGPLPLPEPFDRGITPPYWQLVDAGFTDTWTRRPHFALGLTCCQAEDLLNRKSELYERIDLIFTQQPVWVEDMQVVGARQWDKTLPTRPRLWPSDHAGVAATLHF